jgi:branched-chain amino acid aminotransferase
VTRSVVTDLAESEGFSVRESRYTLDDLRDADEAFLTNSTWEIRPVTSVDGIDVDVGPMTRLLARLFDERVEREHYGGDGSEGAADGEEPTDCEPAADGNPDDDDA